jgi:hypothetical protein
VVVDEAGRLVGSVSAPAVLEHVDGAVPGTRARSRA